MTKRWWVAKVLLILVGSITLTSDPSLGAKKVGLVTPIRGNPLYFLLTIAAEEKGFWKEQGLEVEWLSFAVAWYVDSALATDRAQLAITTAGSVVRRAAGGFIVPIVADLDGFMSWRLWVRSDSPYQSPKDMKGAKIGVTRLGQLTHIYSRAIFRAYGLEREVKYAGTGGIRESIAALRSGVVNGLFGSDFSMALLEHEGVARGVATLADYLPKEWEPLTLQATKTALEKDPEMVGKGVKAILKAASFVMDNSAWATQVIVAESRWPEVVAKKVLTSIRYSRDGKIHPERIEAVKNFYIEHGLVTKDKVPAVRGLYTERFLSAP